MTKKKKKQEKVLVQSYKTEELDFRGLPLKFP